jgi:hypothetical protein
VLSLELGHFAYALAAVTVLFDVYWGYVAWVKR